jgi:hypothetical protein
MGHDGGFIRSCQEAGLILRTSASSGTPYSRRRASHGRPRGRTHPPSTRTRNKSQAGVPIPGQVKAAVSGVVGAGPPHQVPQLGVGQGPGHGSEACAHAGHDVVHEPGLTPAPDRTERGPSGWPPPWRPRVGRDRAGQRRHAQPDTRSPAGRRRAGSPRRSAPGGHRSPISPREETWSLADGAVSMAPSVQAMLHLSARRWLTRPKTAGRGLLRLCARLCGC